MEKKWFCFEMNLAYNSIPLKFILYNFYQSAFLGNVLCYSKMQSNFESHNTFSIVRDNGYLGLTHTLRLGCSRGTVPCLPASPWRRQPSGTQGSSTLPLPPQPPCCRTAHTPGESRSMGDLLIHWPTVTARTTRLC